MVYLSTRSFPQSRPCCPCGRPASRHRRPRFRRPGAYVRCRPLSLPSLHTIDSFSAVSGLGINKTKSCVICTLGPETYHDVIVSLRGGPWTDLPLRPDPTHLGIPIGRSITL